MCILRYGETRCVGWLKASLAVFSGDGDGYIIPDSEIS